MIACYIISFVLFINLICNTYLEEVVPISNTWGFERQPPIRYKYPIWGILLLFILVLIPYFNIGVYTLAYITLISYYPMTKDYETAIWILPKFLSKRI